MIEQIRVKPGTKARIAERDARDTLGLGDKASARQRLDVVRERLATLQARLYAEGERSVLLILQGLDASGKDGVIRSVFTGLNPQSCRVASFKAPSASELARDYLWRVHAVVPQRGDIGIFNRSHYEDVVTVGVLGLAPREVWTRRPAHIVEWERLLTDEGLLTLVADDVAAAVAAELEAESSTEVVRTERAMPYPPSGPVAIPPLNLSV